MSENVKSVTVLEDSSVDRGGCIIETDFGQIDARVSSAALRDRGAHPGARPHPRQGEE